MTMVRAVSAICCLAALLLAGHAAAEDSGAAAPPPTVPGPAAAAPEMRGPRITTAAVDWDAARAEAADAWPALNAATGKLLANVSASGVPVLLPLDTAAFLRDQASGNAADTDKYFADFHAPTFFFPGPSGYDAAFRIPLKDSSVHPAEVQISASSVIYELDGAAADQDASVPELEHDFPGTRRVLLENRLRYVFTRFGVTYFISILCSDGRHARHVTCREADQVMLRFVKALHIAGGALVAAAAAPRRIARPEQTSADFAYFPPGDLLPGTGMLGSGGRGDDTVYADIRFPIAQAPAYINSQSFMNWGNCDLTGLVHLGGHGKESAYRCRVNDIRLFNDETKNYAYPWRDNFCEHRHYQVTQCPSGLGHQGEDIRPSSCKLRNEDADRCEPYQHQVVAVRDGMVWRSAGDEALYLTANAPGEHIRFRYLHMNPHMLDLAGMISGRTVREDDALGPVGDYGAREGGTSYHLHFNLQVPTRQGWLFVNPYMTLVASYERLIGGRGQVVSPAAVAASPIPDTSATPNPAPADAMVATKPAAKSEAGSDHEASKRAAVTEHCTTRFIKGHRRRVCWTAAVETRKRFGRAHLVRAMDRSVPGKGGRARRRTGDLHARNERS
ncbi:MAG TPA: M23 family peptidase [Xanthobacteraceae bacterium]|nr:M23 family peptidase [Xanthobacteraceae bacterium]